MAPGHGHGHGHEGAGGGVQAWERLRERLGRRVDGSALGLFRIAWGTLMVGEAIRKLPKATGIYSPDYFHFKYALFPFVEPLPTNALVQGEIVAMGLAGAAIALGVGMRPAALLYALISAHLFLVEKLYYNNHFYLTVLLNALLAATRADACYSLRAWWARRAGAVPDPTAPFWNLVLLRGQTVIVYFFGGIAKLNADWIQGEPIRHWLRQNPAGPPLSWVLQEEWFVQLVAFGGLVFDLAIGFLLLGRRTFWLAVPFVVGFHLTNDQLFRIGLFPWIGISLCLVFLEPSWPRRAAAWLRERRGRAAPGPTGVAERPGRASTATAAFVVGYLAFQALWPLRIHLLEGNPSWTEVGHNFSWRMMLRDKDGWAIRPRPSACSSKPISSRRSAWRTCSAW